MEMLESRSLKSPLGRCRRAAVRPRSGLRRVLGKIQLHAALNLRGGLFRRFFACPERGALGFQNGLDLLRGINLCGDTLEERLIPRGILRRERNDRIDRAVYRELPRNI